MKFWKRILRSLLRALLFGGIGFLLFTARGYYLDYQEFREYTNYKFASVADFFYQLNAEYWLDFQFVDQNVSEVTLGDRQVRTMEVNVELLGHKYIQAVEEKSLFGTYYRFFDINHDMAYANFEADMELNVHYTQLQGLKLKDGFAIQLISSDRYQDNYGPPSQTIEGGSTYFSNFSEDGNELVQLFWVEGDELPEGYRLFCRRESLTIGYDMLVGLYHDNEKRK